LNRRAGLDVRARRYSTTHVRHLCCGAHTYRFILPVPLLRTHRFQALLLRHHAGISALPLTRANAALPARRGGRRKRYLHHPRCLYRRRIFLPLHAFAAFRGVYLGVPPFAAARRLRTVYRHLTPRFRFPLRVGDHHASLRNLPLKPPLLPPPAESLPLRWRLFRCRHFFCGACQHATFTVPWWRTPRDIMGRSYAAAFRATRRAPPPGVSRLKQTATIGGVAAAVGAASSF